MSISRESFTRNPLLPFSKANFLERFLKVDREGRNGEIRSDRGMKMKEMMADRRRREKEGSSQFHLPGLVILAGTEAYCTKRRCRHEERQIRSIKLELMRLRNCGWAS